MVALLLVGGSAHADTHCRALEGANPALEHIDAAVRLRFIKEGLDDGARRARIWSWTWAGIYSASTLANGIVTATAGSQGAQIDGAIGTGASFVGLAVIIISPLKVMRDSRWLDKRLRLAPPGTDPCALLADAERLLVRSADSEAFGRGPLVHVGSFLFNVGLLLLQGFVFNHWQAAMITGLSGIVVGELQIFSQPDDVVLLLDDYKSARLDATSHARRWRWLVAPTASRDHYGLSLAFSF